MLRSLTVDVMSLEGCHGAPPKTLKTLRPWFVSGSHVPSLRLDHCSVARELVPGHRKSSGFKKAEVPSWGSLGDIIGVIVCWDN